MVQSTKLRWKIYFFLAVPLWISNLFVLFQPDSSPYTYYNVLITFHENYTLAYFLAIAGAVVNVLTLIPFYLYIFQIQFLPVRLWQWLFVFKVFFDAFGHHYEFNFLKSLLYSNRLYASLSVALILLFILPPYVACYRYAFRQDKLFTK